MMAEQNIIKTEINGVEVEGKICQRSSRDFQIEIIKPYQSIEGGCHIPYFSGRWFSYNGEYGDQRILHKLNQLYGLGSYLNENMTSLKSKLREAEQKIEKVSEGIITESEFREIKIKLRRLLKQGEITGRYQQKVLRWWRAEMETLRLDIELNIMDPFFEDNFPMVITLGTKDQVLDILKGKKQLTGGMG